MKRCAIWNVDENQNSFIFRVEAAKTQIPAQFEIIRAFLAIGSPELLLISTVAHQDDPMTKLSFSPQNSLLQTLTAHFAWGKNIFRLKISILFWTISKYRHQFTVEQFVHLTIVILKFKHFETFHIIFFSYNQNHITLLSQCLRMPETKLSVS